MLDGAVERIRSAAIDTGEPQRHGVTPGRMPGLIHQQHRITGRGLIEKPLVLGLLLEDIVHPTATGDPLPRLRLRGAGGHCRLDFRGRRFAAQNAAAHHLAGTHRVDMHIVQTGQYRPAAQIDDARPGTFEGLNVGVSSNRHDHSIAHGEGFGPTAVKLVDLSAYQDRVRGRRPFIGRGFGGGQRMDRDHGQHGRTDQPTWEGPTHSHTSAPCDWLGNTTDRPPRRSVVCIFPAVFHDLVLPGRCPSRSPWCARGTDPDISVIFLAAAIPERL